MWSMRLITATSTGAADATGEAGAAAAEAEGEGGAGTSDQGPLRHGHGDASGSAALHAAQPPRRPGRRQPVAGLPTLQDHGLAASLRRPPSTPGILPSRAAARPAPFPPFSPNPTSIQNSPCDRSLKMCKPTPACHGPTEFSGPWPRGISSSDPLNPRYSA